jgi:hypothetical protein
LNSSIVSSFCFSAAESAAFAWQFTVVFSGIVGYARAGAARPMELADNKMRTTPSRVGTE